MLEQRFKQRKLSRSSASQRPAIALRRTAASGIPISEGLYGRSVSIRGAFVAGQLLHHWRNEENSYGRGFAHTWLSDLPLMLWFRVDDCMAHSNSGARSERRSRNSTARVAGISSLSALAAFMFSDSSEHLASPRVLEPKQRSGPCCTSGSAPWSGKGPRAHSIEYNPSPTHCASESAAADSVQARPARRIGLDRHAWATYWVCKSHLGVPPSTLWRP